MTTTATRKPRRQPDPEPILLKDYVKLSDDEKRRYQRRGELSQLFVDASRSIAHEISQYAEAVGCEVEVCAPDGDSKMFRRKTGGLIGESVCRRRTDSELHEGTAEIVGPQFDVDFSTDPHGQIADKLAKYIERLIKVRDILRLWSIEQASKSPVE